MKVKQLRFALSTVSKHRTSKVEKHDSANQWLSFARTEEIASMASSHVVKPNQRNSVHQSGSTALKQTY